MRGPSRLWLFVVLASLSACGGGSDPGPAPPSSCPEIGLPLLTAQQLAVPVPQVVIEVKFVTANRQDVLNLGINWSQFTDVTTGNIPSGGASNCGPGLGVATSVIGGAAGQIAAVSPFQTGALPLPMVRSVPVLLGDGGQVYTNLGGSGAYTVADILRESLDGLSDVPLGIVLTPQLATTDSSLNYLLTDDAGSAQFISEIQAISNSHIVAAPTITVMSNQYATILVPTETPTIPDLTEPMKSQVTALDPTIPNVEVGVAAQLTPTIPQVGIIQLGFDFGIEAVAAVPQTVFQLNGTVDSALQVPILGPSGLGSSILLNDGNTVIIGGVRDNGTMTTTLGVPFLEKLPLVGAYLRQHKQLDTRDALLVLIKAEILDNP